jgi:hypothetical protein
MILNINMANLLEESKMNRNNIQTIDKLYHRTTLVSSSWSASNVISCHARINAKSGKKEVADTFMFSVYFFFIFF